MGAKDLQPRISFFHGKQFKHNTFGDEFVKKHKLIKFEGEIYIKDGFIYTSSRDIIYSKMIDMLPRIKESHRIETYKYLHYNKKIENKDPHEFAFATKDGVFVFDENKKIFVIDNDVIVFNQINARKTKDKCKDIDNFLESFTNNDKQKLEMYLQFAGLSLIRTMKFQKAMFIEGMKGGNGKSTFADLLISTIGKQNISFIPLQALVENQFMAAKLKGKLLNIGDDTEKTFIKQTGKIKRIITGNEDQYESKFVESFNYSPTAKHIYFGNEIPNADDSSDAWSDRFLLGKANTRFRDTAQEIKGLNKLLTTESAINYFLGLIIRSLEKLLVDNKFTLSNDTIEMVSEYKMAHDPIASWLEMIEQKQDYLLKHSFSFLFSEFKRITKYTELSNKMFSKMVRGKYDFTIIKKTVNNKTDTYFSKGGK